jgi:putative ATP-binding cassette transporter
MRTLQIKVVILLTFSLCGTGHLSFSQEGASGIPLSRVDDEVRKWMREGDIPGLDLVIIKGDSQLIRSYGYSDIARKRPVTPNTLFELGSCSKAFTALAVMDLERRGRLNLDSGIATYIPWFKAYYKTREVKITLRQLLHHTSGIPWSTISGIPETAGENALELTVRQLSGQKLRNLPGKKYEYATINYDVLALIVQNVAGQPFETYLQENIIDKLGLRNTTIGYPSDSTQKATGYKIGFFEPRQYKAPIFRGNNAAGYVTSNGVDISNWLYFQMGLSGNQLYGLAASTHLRDETVPLHDMSSYAMGWQVSLSGNGEIYHDGFNPNFTSYIAFRPKDKLGIAVLANSNSNFTPFIGNRIMKMLAGEDTKKVFDPGGGNDKIFSVISIILSCYLLITIAFLILVISGIIKGGRQYDGFSPGKLGKIGLSLVILLPFLFALFILPEALAGFTWKALFVWSPISLLTTVVLVLASLCSSYCTYVLSLFFPERNKYKRMAPRLVLLSMFSGLANMMLIVLITSSLDSSVRLRYLVFYYVLTFSVYVLGRRYVQTNLIRLSRDLTFELRIKLIDKIFSTSYQKFEKIDRGRVYTALNDDMATIGESANTFITLAASFITAGGAFIYLATIAFWSTMLTVLILAIVAGLYYSITKSTAVFFEKARDTQNVFVRLTNGIIDGCKEIGLRRNKKLEYKADMVACAGEYKSKISAASIRFVNGYLVGESILIVSLGVVTFAFPKLFPGIPLYTIMSFIVILLYLIAPINAILSAAPAVMQFRVAWNRIKQFSREIPANLDLKAVPARVARDISGIRANGIKFQYKNDYGAFTVGPIDLEARKGEILFIIGGNGSGKTTLAKLLTGLYEPDEGELMIDNKVVRAAQVSEYFSAVFSPVYLFEKLYDINISEKGPEVKKYLKLLDLEDKVRIKDNKYSTIDLSGGQRKRLALLQCYLEDSPIYLFDEWAADQDPEYRNFFYRTLLPEMRNKGKILIAITHDDHYFDVADKVLKMHEGRLEEYTVRYPNKQTIIV